MKTNSDYLKINRENWNKRTLVHVESEFYNVKDFLNGQTSLNDIELGLLDNVKGKSILHLQCHFGMDSISLSRMESAVTAVDFSENAINEAKKLNAKAGQNVEFIHSDVYSLKLDKEFDIVFTSYGVIGWLPDMDEWANIISKHLRTGGKLVFVEFHPIVWMFDNQFKTIAYNYAKAEEIEEIETGSYADKTSDMKNKTITWNHSLSEVMGSLIRAGLHINVFDEFDYSPYNCFEGTEEFEKGKFRIKNLGNKIPMVYSLLAEKKVIL